VITGLLIMGVGVLFWTTNGLIGVPELVPLEAQVWLQERAALLSDPVLEVAAVLVVATAVLLLWRRRRSRQRSGTTESPGEEA
jgi:ABC-type xylose transport system permease subunit